SCAQWFDAVTLAEKMSDFLPLDGVAGASFGRLWTLSKRSSTPRRLDGFPIRHRGEAGFDRRSRAKERCGGTTGFRDTGRRRLRAAENVHGPMGESISPLC